MRKQSSDADRTDFNTVSCIDAVSQQQGESVFIHFHVICDFLIEHKITDSETLFWMTQAKSQVMRMLHH